MFVVMMPSLVEDDDVALFLSEERAVAHAREHARRRAAGSGLEERLTPSMVDDGWRYYAWWHPWEDGCSVWVTEREPVDG